MEAKIKIEKLRGLRTGWLENGNPEGPMFLFLHGYPDTPEIWDPQAAHLGERFLVVRPFGRGVGPSEPGRTLSRYGREAVALDVLSILRHIDPAGKRPVAVAGHDLGGIHAAYLARLLGKRLSGLVLINTLSLEQASRRFRRPGQWLRSWYIYPMLVPGLMERVLPWLPKPLLSLGRPRRLPAPPRGLEPWIHPINQYRALTAELPQVWKSRGPRLQRPVLVLWGLKDPFVLPTKADEWSGFAADVTLRILPGGHWIYREKPDEVNALIDDFLAQKGAFHAH